jgi:heme O synthase-like polyprenyltransferase
MHRERVRAAYEAAGLGMEVPPELPCPLNTHALLHALCAALLLLTATCLLLLLLHHSLIYACAGSACVLRMRLPAWAWRCLRSCRVPSTDGNLFAAAAAAASILHSCMHRERVRAAYEAAGLGMEVPPELPQCTQLTAACLLLLLLLLLLPHFCMFRERVRAAYEAAGLGMEVPPRLILCTQHSCICTCISAQHCSC